MTDCSQQAPFRRDIQSWTREQIEAYQLDRLNKLLSQILPTNDFYRKKLQRDTLRLRSLDDWKTVPTSTKQEWISSEPSGVALHHTYPEVAYRRYHRTSGTRGKPMVILDTESDWDWWVNTWQYVLDACNITRQDRVMMAFSFGPFIGFWSAHDACLRRECMVIPSGGMSTLARIEMIKSSKPTVLFSTPSYAIHLGQEAQRRGLSLRDSSVRCVFVAGEPGGSVQEIRASIETLYGAQVMDHAGATEVGPWGFGAEDGLSLRVIESEFIAEFLPPVTSISTNRSDAQHGAHRSADHAGNSDELRELVITSLGRSGAPVLRYRTGDLVRPCYDAGEGTSFVRLQGGVVGRADDMIVIRGVNLFPSSIEAIVRSFPEVGEFRLTLTKNGALDELKLQVEDGLHSPNRIAERFLVQLNLRVEVEDVAEGTLPKPDGKSRRVVDQR